MLALALVALPAFTPCNAPLSSVSRAAVRTNAPLMGADESSTRRQLFAKAGAALLGVSLVQSASAKSGQMGKLGFFGMNDLSSPYQPGGPQAGPESTFGYAKSAGPILSSGYESDVAREKALFEESVKRLSGLQGKIDSKTWWFVRDELRIQAYSMRSSMLAMNGVLSGDKAASAEAAYKSFWKTVEKLDLACVKKESALATKYYGDVLAAMKAYSDIAA